MTMNRNWLVTKTNPEFLDYLSKEASISPVLAQVMVNRGFKDAASIKDFLFPSLSNLHDPFLMPDMGKAVERLRSAIDRRETVFVHGDYDADGITSTALLVSSLRKLGVKTCYHIPNRIIEGYGLSHRGVQKAKDCGATLIITADCGISSGQEVMNAVSLGIDVIVTDHHEPPEKLPDATAVIDPHRPDSEYPFRQLAGVGVAFKLVQALYYDFPEKGRELRIEDLLDLVALGTMADSVSLIDENRIFATIGLKAINHDRCRVGIMAIKEAAGIEGKIRPGSLPYSLIPRINAAGRLDDASEVVELFLTSERDVARSMASVLETQNRKRQKIEMDVFQSALGMINPDEIGNSIILSSGDWHPGVIGIVASRLVDMFYRPVFLFSVRDSVAKGSARSIPPLHLYEAISSCSDLLLGFGGHRQAAGLRLSTENMSLFRKRMESIVEKKLEPGDMIPVLEIDATVTFSDINYGLIKELSLLEPHGDSNRAPVFGAKDISVLHHKIVGNNHLKMQLKQDSVNVDTIGFSMGSEIGRIMNASSIDIAFHPAINEWQGIKNLQLNLKAVRPNT
jgi:single-stranded-DNA-specific exonuclease